MNKLVFLSLSIFVVILFSCSKDNETINEKETPEKEIPSADNIILGESTILLTNKQISHIIEVKEDGNLIFDSSTDKSILPTVGKILLISQPHEKFPYGFLGKVTNVTNDSGQYIIETTTANLDEAFDYLQINTTVDLVPENVTQTRLSLSKDEDGFWLLSQNFDFSQNNASISGAAEVGLKLTVCIDINRNIKKSYVYFTLQSKFNLNTDFKLTLKGKLPKTEVPIGMPIPLTCSLSNILVEPVVQFYYVSEAEGEISTTAHFAYSAGNTAAISYNKGIWEKNSHNIPGRTTFSLDYISLNGSFFSGIATGLEIRLFGMKNLSASFQPKIGANWSGNFTLNSTSTYESLKEANVEASFGLRVDAEVSSGVMNKQDSKFSEKLLDIPFYKKSYYLLPSFGNMSVAFNKSKMVATISSNVKRDLLFPVSIGYGLYNTSGTLIDITLPDTYQKESEFPSLWQKTFLNLNTNTKYQVCPYLNFREIKMLALSERKVFSTKESLIIGTWKFHSYSFLSTCPEAADHEPVWDSPITFNEDGSVYSVTENGTHMVGKYIYDENTRILTLSNFSVSDKPYGGSVAVEFVDDDTLCYIDNDDECECVYRVVYKRIK